MSACHSAGDQERGSVIPSDISGTLLLTAGAWAGSNVPLMSLGITDPRSWSPEEWQADLVPHAAYGLTTALVVALLR